MSHTATDTSNSDVRSTGMDIAAALYRVNCLMADVTEAVCQLDVTDESNAELFGSVVDTFLSARKALAAARNLKAGA